MSSGIDRTQLPFALPAGACEVLLVRHGAVDASSKALRAELVDGRSDPPLSPLGQQQAEAVAEHLEGFGAAALFVTPLLRTRQTAMPLIERTGLDPVEIAALREVHVGRVEDQDTPLIAQVLRAGRSDVGRGAEPPEAFAARVSAGLAQVADMVGPDAGGIAFVHGFVIAEACRQTTGSLPLAFLQAENGSITRLIRMRSGRWILRVFNETSHLRNRA